jgi:hypothetical protein
MRLFQCTLGAVVIQFLMIMVAQGKETLAKTIPLTALVGMLSGLTAKLAIDELDMYRGALPMHPWFSRSILRLSILCKVTCVIFALFVMPWLWPKK